MNAWTFAFFPALALWSFFYDPALLIIYLTLLSMYTLSSVLRNPRHPNQAKAKICDSLWSRAGSPAAFGRLEVDMIEIDVMLAKYNFERPSATKLTYTAVFLRALAEGLKSASCFSGSLACGVFVPSETIDLSTAVSLENGEHLTMVVIRDCGAKGIEVIGARLRAEVSKTRAGENVIQKFQTQLLWSLPSFVVALLISLVAWLTCELGIGCAFLGMEAKPAGISGVSNLATFGLTDVVGGLIPLGDFPVGGAINAPKDKVMVVDGKVVVRKVMNFNITYDRRCGDEREFGKLCEGVLKVLEHPENFL